MTGNQASLYLKIIDDPEALAKFKALLQVRHTVARIEETRQAQAAKAFDDWRDSLVR